MPERMLSTVSCIQIVYVIWLSFAVRSQISSAQTFFPSLRSGNHSVLMQNFGVGAILSKMTILEVRNRSRWPTGRLDLIESFFFFFVNSHFRLVTYLDYRIRGAGPILSSSWQFFFESIGKFQIAQSMISSTLGGLGCVKGASCHRMIALSQRHVSAHARSWKDSQIHRIAC